MEHRGQKYHRGRLSAAIREEIETILEGELGDPRIGLASVSAVLMAQDARSARIMVTVAGDEAEAERTLEGLTAAKNYRPARTRGTPASAPPSGTLFPDRSCR